MQKKTVKKILASTVGAGLLGVLGWRLKATNQTKTEAQRSNTNAQNNTSNKRPADLDRLQSIRDVFFTKNAYKLDDRFVIRDGKPHPFAVICPGGGYQMVCSFIEGVPIAKRLNEQGISAFIVYYRVKKKARFPAPQDDLARAVREILEKAEEYQLDAENYSVWGSSAGGHLAACFGTESMGYVKYGLPGPRAMVLIYPVISMEKGMTHGGSHDNLLGKEATQEQEQAASVDLHVTAAYPPTYIWCGDADDVVPPENTKRMAAALERSGVLCLCEVFPDVGHGVGPATGTSAQGWIDHAIAFWSERK